LLRAALLAPRDAEAAWLSWVGAVDFEQDFIDQGSFRLLPLVYRNLAAHDAGLPWFSRLAGIYRQSWYQNQVILRACADLLQRFEAQGIRALVFKGIPLSVLYYADMGARPMGDADVLVPRKRIHEAVELMQADGWKADFFGGDVPEDCFELVHGLGFSHPRKAKLDIHASAFHSHYRDALNGDLWNTAIGFSFNTFHSETFSAEYQLINACSHGFAWNVVPPIRWVADAVKIIGTAPLDWDLLAESAITHDLHGDIVWNLDYLRKVWNQPVPGRIVDRLRKAPVSRQKRALLRVVSRRMATPMDGVRKLWALHDYYCSSVGRTRLLYRLAHFPKYIMAVRGLRDTRSLLSWGWEKFSERTRYWYRRRRAATSSTDRAGVR
jgi:hypothetical protein